MIGGLLCTLYLFIDFLPLQYSAVLLSIIEAVAKSVCSLLILYKAKKQKCFHMLKKKN